MSTKEALLQEPLEKMKGGNVQETIVKAYSSYKTDRFIKNDH